MTIGLQHTEVQNGLIYCPSRLHGERDYNKLHETMERSGFSRRIKGSDGKVYRLPTGQYRVESTRIDRAAVLRKAKLLAALTLKKASITVTEGRTSWSGLEEVKPLANSRR